LAPLEIAGNGSVVAFNAGRRFLQAQGGFSACADQKKSRKKNNGPKKKEDDSHKKTS